MINYSYKILFLLKLTLTYPSTKKLKAQSSKYKLKMEKRSKFAMSYWIPKFYDRIFGVPRFSPKRAAGRPQAPPPAPAADRPPARGGTPSSPPARRTRLRNTASRPRRCVKAMRWFVADNYLPFPWVQLSSPSPCSFFLAPSFDELLKPKLSSMRRLMSSSTFNTIYRIWSVTAHLTTYRKQASSPAPLPADAIREPPKHSWKLDNHGSQAMGIKKNNQK